MSYCQFQTPAIIRTAEGEYFSTNPSDTHVDNPELDLFSILGNLEFDAELLHICQEPFPELHIDTPECHHLLLPTSSSQCCLEEGVHQCDVLLANHPLLPHLQELIQGNPNHPLLSSPDLAKGLCTGVQEADYLMQKAVNMLGKCDVSGSINYVKQVDNDCSALAHEISSFCQTMLESPQDKKSTQQSSNIECICQQSTSAEISKQSSKFLQKDVCPTKSSREPDIQLRKRRSSLSNKAAAVLRQWLFEHAHHPYPNDDEKDELCLRTSLTSTQLNNWFSNARRRVLPPYLNQCERL